MLPELTKAQIRAFFRKNASTWKNTGNAIKEMRLQLKISRRELAKRAGIAPQTLKKLENGKYIRRFKTVSKSCINALELELMKNNFVCIKEKIKLN